MADLTYNQSNFDDLLGRLNANITKIQGEIETFDQNFNIIKANWSGSEFDKAEVKLMEIKSTLEKALDDQKSQRSYLETKNSDFAGIVTGL